MVCQPIWLPQAATKPMSRADFSDVEQPELRVAGVAMVSVFHESHQCSALRVTGICRRPPDKSGIVFRIFL